MTLTKEKKFNIARDKCELVKSDVWQEIRRNQLEMIIECARNGYEGNDLRAMLKLIAKTDDWEKEFTKAQSSR